MRYPGDGQSMFYDEGVLVGYRWYDAMDEEPLFPFGHGLSYTQFEYSDLKISGVGDERVIEFKLKNAGDRPGAEVVQLYVKVPDEAKEPPRQLKGFDKIMLEPGETKTVMLLLGNENLKMYDEFDQAWKLFPGYYEVMLGASSRDIRLRGEFFIEEEAQGKTYKTLSSFIIFLEPGALRPAPLFILPETAVKAGCRHRPLRKSCPAILPPWSRLQALWPFRYGAFGTLSIPAAHASVL
jgi:hypothetical protein